MIRYTAMLQHLDAYFPLRVPEKQHVLAFATHAARAAKELSELI